MAITYLHSGKSGLGGKRFGVEHSLNLGKAPKREGRLPFYALTFILVVFAGLRYGVGSDYFLYATLYRLVLPMSLADSLSLVPQELGWVTLAFVLKRFTDSPYAIFWAASFLSVAPVLLALRRKSSNASLSVFLFFFLGYYAVTFNAVRQSIAVAFLLLADTYREESRFKWFLFSTIAVLFHSSALIAIAVQLLVLLWKPTARSVIVMLVLGASFSFVLLRSPLAAQAASALNPRYETYLNDEGSGFGTWLVLAARVLVIFLALAAPRTDETGKYLAYVCVSAVVLLLGTSNVVFARFEPYFGIYLALLIPPQLALLKHRSAITALFVGCSLVYFGFHISNFNAVVPYVVIPELTE